MDNGTATAVLLLLSVATALVLLLLQGRQKSQSRIPRLSEGNRKL
jgi:hypothetical protein